MAPGGRRSICREQESLGLGSSGSLSSLKQIYNYNYICVCVSISVSISRYSSLSLYIYKYKYIYIYLFIHTCICILSTRHRLTLGAMAGVIEKLLGHRSTVHLRIDFHFCAKNWRKKSFSSAGFAPRPPGGETSQGLELPEPEPEREAPRPRLPRAGIARAVPGLGPWGGTFPNFELSR